MSFLKAFKMRLYSIFCICYMAFYLQLLYCFYYFSKKFLVVRCFIYVVNITLHKLRHADWRRWANPFYWWDIASLNVKTSEYLPSGIYLSEIAGKMGRGQHAQDMGARDQLLYASQLRNQLAHVLSRFTLVVLCHMFYGHRTRKCKGLVAISNR